MVDVQPAVALTTRSRAHATLCGLHAGDPAVLARDSRDLGEGVQLDAEPVGSAGVAPDDPVVPGNSRRRMVQRPDDGERLPLPQVYLWDDPLDLTRLDEATVHAHQPVVLDALSKPEQGGLRVSNVQPSDLAEQNVQVELRRKLLVQLQACVHEGYPLGREVVGADDGRVPPARSRAEIALVEHGDPLHAELGEVIGGRETVHAPADDDHVIVRRKVGLPPKTLFPKDLQNHQISPQRARRAQRPKGVSPCRSPASMSDSHIWSP